jgi:hypothetical protein
LQEGKAPVIAETAPLLGLAKANAELVLDLQCRRTAPPTAAPRACGASKRSCNAACDGGSAQPPGSEDINRALAAVTGIGARDETEGMLASQMVATHFAAMGILRRLKGSETIPQQDSNGNLAVKLLRTFTMQVEALQRYRGKGQQKVTVEHVHVHSGGQAIVGAVTPGGKGP